MTFANPAALGLLALAIPILLLHILRPRREQRTVPSTFLWRSVAQPVSAARPWQRLRPSLLLFLQLLAVALLAVAVADPVRITDGAARRAHRLHHRRLGLDGRPGRRPDPARRGQGRGDRAASQLPEGGIASIVVADGNPRSSSPPAPTPTRSLAPCGPIEPTTGPADWARRLHVAVSLETVGAEIGFHLLTDGRAHRRRASGSSRAGAATPSSASARPTGRSWRLVVEPRGSRTARHGDDRQHRRRAAPPTGSASTSTASRPSERRASPSTKARRTVVEVDLPAGDRVEAFLEGDDLLDADDHAFATAGRRRALTVLLCTPGARPATPSSKGSFAAGRGRHRRALRGLSARHRRRPRHLRPGGGARRSRRAVPRHRARRAACPPPAIVEPARSRAR